MKSMKWVVLILVLVLVAVLVVGCGGNSNNNNANTGNDEPVVVPGTAMTTHGTDGAYENCMQCHSDVAESHANWDNFEERCLDCHEVAN